jgi:DNA-binding response OmpR family regulator
MKILFVDDDEDLTEMIGLVGENAGAETEVMTSGHDALRYLDNADPPVDVVILDLMMPTLDGLTIAEEIRHNEAIHPARKPAKIAFLTAADINEAVTRVGERVGVKKIFRKPCHYPALFEEAKTWVEND